jgi:murein DD-endopeptidase MepM/ murein hydrolase activator NlpD
MQGAGGQIYTVIAGDSVDSVAQRFGVPVQAVIQANNLAIPYELRGGQRLVIPGAGGASANTGAAAGIYVVSPGDTLYRIARHHGTTMETLAQMNGLTSPYKIRVGQSLRLPGAPVVQTANADPGGISSLPPAMPAPSLPAASRPEVTTETLAPPPGTAAAPPAPSPSSSGAMATTRVAPPPALTPFKPAAPPSGYGSAATPPEPSTMAPPPAPSLPAAKPPSSPAEAPTSGMAAATHSATPLEPPSGQSPAVLPEPVARGSGKFLWPVNGKVVSPFGPKDGGLHNDGINIAAPLGTPVRAADNGVVVYAGNELRGFGNLLLVRHAGGWVSAYAHCDALLVKRGQEVKRGQVIARVGQTGNVAAPQLHFELRKGAQAINPMNELGAQGA